VTCRDTVWGTAVPYLAWRQQVPARASCAARPSTPVRPCPRLLIRPGSMKCMMRFGPGRCLRVPGCCSCPAARAVCANSRWAGGGSSGGPPISREMQAEIGRFQDLQAGIRVAGYERVSWGLCSGARFRPVNGGVVNCGKTVVGWVACAGPYHLTPPASPVHPQPLVALFGECSRCP
jgi:hypothetical protein